MAVLPISRRTLCCRLIERTRLPTPPSRWQDASGRVDDDQLPQRDATRVRIAVRMRRDARRRVPSDRWHEVVDRPAGPKSVMAAQSCASARCRVTGSSGRHLAPSPPTTTPAIAGEIAVAGVVVVGAARSRGATRRVRALAATKVSLMVGA